jgi:hypothetical protein
MQSKAEIIITNLRKFDIAPWTIDQVSNELNWLETNGKEIVPRAFYKKYLIPCLEREQGNENGQWFSNDKNFRLVLTLAFSEQLPLTTLEKFWTKISPDQQMSYLHYGRFLVFVTNGGAMRRMKLLLNTFRSYLSENPEKDYEVVWEIKRALLLPCKLEEPKSFKTINYLLGMVVEFSKGSNNFWQKYLNLGDLDLRSGHTSFFKFFADLYFQHTANCHFKNDSQSKNNIKVLNKFLQEHFTTKRQVHQFIKEIMQRLATTDPFKGIRMPDREIDKYGDAKVVANQCRDGIWELFKSTYPNEYDELRREEEENEEKLLTDLTQQLNNSLGYESSYRNRLFIFRDPNRDELFKKVSVVINNENLNSWEILREIEEIGNEAQKHHVDHSGARFLGTGALLYETCQFKLITDKIVEDFKKKLNEEVSENHCRKIVMGPN